MIRETLTAIGQAGRQALQCLGSRVEVRSQVNQVREWSFAMPNLGRVIVANSPLHQVYVGISQPLAQALGDAARQEVLLEEFKQALVARIPSKRPIGSWELLPFDPQPRVLRGVRSFILRQQTAAGNLYLMADIASRGEFESLRQGAWEEELVAKLLPRDLARAENIESPAAVQRVGTYLARFEHDIELHVPGSEGTVHSGNGVLLQLGKLHDRMLMRLSLDLDKELLAALSPGLELEGSFGAAGRVFRFRTRCVGHSVLPLEGVADLPCALFEMPERFSLDQRRRYFRVAPELPLLAELQVLPPLLDDEEMLFSQPPATAQKPQMVSARITDLSFSGIGLILSGPPPVDLKRDGRVHLHLCGDGLPQSLTLTGLVRRLDHRPSGRGRSETHLGVEFVIEQPSDQQSTHHLRQYVMAQQRQLLSRRTQPSTTSS